MLTKNRRKNHIRKFLFDFLSTLLSVLSIRNFSLLFCIKSQQTNRQTNAKVRINSQKQEQTSVRPQFFSLNKMQSEEKRVGWEGKRSAEGKTVRGGGKSSLCWVYSVPRPYKVVPFAGAPQNNSNYKKQLGEKKAGLSRHKPTSPQQLKNQWNTV